MTDKLIRTNELDTTEVPEVKEMQAMSLERDTPDPPIIWTPSFIIIFTLLLIIGLSLSSVLTQGWLNGYYAPEAVLLVYSILLFGSWLVVSIRAHSAWTRTGGIFGCLWAIFTAISFVLSWQKVDPALSITAHTNAATNSTLLGSTICLSLAHTPFRAWDRWFFRILLVASVAIIAIIFLLTFAGNRPFIFFESSSAAVFLSLSIAVWWLRPACWHSQLGPTFLLGLAPTILLILAISNGVTGDVNFCFLQISLLASFLGSVRIAQCEIRH